MKEGQSCQSLTFGSHGVLCNHCTLYFSGPVVGWLEIPSLKSCCQTSSVHPPFPPYVFNHISLESHVAVPTPMLSFRCSSRVKQGQNRNHQTACKKDSLTKIKPLLHVADCLSLKLNAATVYCSRSQKLVASRPKLKEDEL